MAHLRPHGVGILRTRSYLSPPQCQVFVGLMTLETDSRAAVAKILTLDIH